MVPVLPPPDLKKDKTADVQIKITLKTYYIESRTSKKGLAGYLN
jgi:hypothetical protein